MSNLPEELVREILSRVPLTSLSALRCTCRTWNALSKTQVFGNKAARKQFLGFTVISNRICSLRLDIKGIFKEGDLVHQSTKQIRKLDKIKMYKVFHSDGLLLCTEDRRNLVVWNPYLGETRCIQPRRDFGLNKMFAFGYDTNKRNHKILRIFYVKDHPLFCFELFDFETSSWRFLDIEPDFDLDFWQNGVSVKGNTYFVAQHNTAEFVDVLLCFDFTTERFRQPLPFPFDAEYVKNLSCVREEKLAVLYKHEDTIEIWITTNIEHDAVSWSKFLNVEMIPLNGFPDDFAYKSQSESFFIDEEKKIAVVFNLFEDKPTKSQICYSQTAHIIGQDGYLKSVSIAEARNHVLDEPLVFSSYVPSLVQLGINQRIKGKHKDRFYRRKRNKNIKGQV